MFVWLNRIYLWYCCCCDGGKDIAADCKFGVTFVSKARSASSKSLREYLYFFLLSMFFALTWTIALFQHLEISWDDRLVSVYFKNVSHCIKEEILCRIPHTCSVHKITAGHRSLSGAISRVTDRIRFLPVTMTGRFSNYNSILYTRVIYKADLRSYDRGKSQMIGQNLLARSSWSSRIFIKTSSMIL